MTMLSELIMLKCLTGLSQLILTGRSTDFEIYALDNEEQGAVIKIPPSSDKTYKFGLVDKVMERSGKKEYMTEVFSVGQLDQETEIKIEKTQSGLKEVKMMNQETEILRPEYEAMYRESDRDSDLNWTKWLENRHLYKSEGPIFLSDQTVTGGKTVRELGEQLRVLVEKEIIR